MIWEIGSIFKHVVLPPLGFGWLFLLAWLLMRRRPRTARWLFGLTLLCSYLATTPLVSNFLMHRFVEDHRFVAAQPEAIVVLGGGRGLSFDKNGQVTEAFAAGSTLERLLTGARLQRLTGLPLLVTGGKPDGYDPPEGVVMRDTLVNDFKVPVRWTEAASRNTVENAQFSAPLLHAAGIKTIFLVTHDFHMRRARALFENQGFVVVPAPALEPLAVGASLSDGMSQPFRWRDLVPAMPAATRTFLACNEIAGMVYARLSMR